MQIDWTCEFGNVKAIIQLKKTITLGVLPQSFSIIANKLQEIEGTFTDGFDNNITPLLDQQNWQVDNCKQGKPQVVLIRQLNHYAFDLHCFPLFDGQPQAIVKPFHPSSGFKEFNPAITGPLIRIPQMQSLVDTYLRCGDEADLALLKYAHTLTEQLCIFLIRSIDVQQIKGQSIQDLVCSIDQLTPDIHMR